MKNPSPLMFECSTGHVQFLCVCVDLLCSQWSILIEFVCFVTFSFFVFLLKLDSRYVILDNGDLLIRNSSRSDNGYYRCQTRHELSQETVLSSIEGHFIVNGKLFHYIRFFLFGEFQIT